MWIEVEELAQSTGIVTALTTGHQCLGADGRSVQKLLHDPVHREANLVVGIVWEVVGKTLAQAREL
jgi:hypothetical protein